MRALRAHVENGRLVMDEPTELPEGTVLELVVADPGDELGDDERAALHSALSRAWQSAAAGEGVPASDVIRELGPKK